LNAQEDRLVLGRPHCGTVLARHSAIYEARETYAGMLFRVFCALEPAAPGAPALAILSGDTRPEGRDRNAHSP
jgi:hypothetical protein